MSSRVPHPGRPSHPVNLDPCFLLDLPAIIATIKPELGNQI